MKIVGTVKNILFGLKLNSNQEFNFGTVEPHVYICAQVKISANHCEDKKK